MEQIQNHRSVDSQPIWLKSVRSEADWLDITNPWLKEVIKSDPQLIFNILYGESLPPSLLHTFLAHLDEFWWMLQSTGWGVSQINSPMDNCIQWDSDLAQLDTDQALMDSPSAYLAYVLGICAPWAGSPCFYIYPSTTPSSKLVRVGLKGLLL